jgi:hypothetical protein
MSIRFGLGGFPEFLTPNTLGGGAVQLSRVPSVSNLLSQSKADLSKSLKSFQSLDHVVFRLSGENPNELVQILRIHGLSKEFSRRTFSVSFWTMDSHHMGKHEARASKFFDYVFVAHKPYLGLFDSAKAFYLPCSFSISSSADAKRYLLEAPARKPGKAEGVCAPFAAYPWQERNRGYSNLLGQIKTMDVENSFFGVVRGGKKPNEALIRKILEHKVVLNLSLSDDLNMRNFEALALNRILLTNKVQDHELFTKWEENIVFLDRYFDNPGQAILESLNRSPKDISKQFLSEHGIEARVFRILEIISGYVRGQDDVGFANRIGSHQVESLNQGLDNVAEIPHTQTELLAKSGWVHPGSALRLIRESNSRWETLLNFASIWVESFGFHILKSTIGRSSLIRAVLRIMA